MTVDVAVSRCTIHIHEPTIGGVEWILRDGAWDDRARWDDTELWRDEASQPSDVAWIVKDGTWDDQAYWDDADYWNDGGSAAVYQVIRAYPPRFETAPKSLLSEWCLFPPSVDQINPPSLEAEYQVYVPEIDALKSLQAVEGELRALPPFVETAIDEAAFRSSFLPPRLDLALPFLEAGLRALSPYLEAATSEIPVARSEIRAYVPATGDRIKALEGRFTPYPPTIIHFRWILRTGSWRDTGGWFDTECWNDGIAHGVDATLMAYAPDVGPTYAIRAGYAKADFLAIMPQITTSNIPTALSDCLVHTPMTEIALQPAQADITLNVPDISPEQYAFIVVPARVAKWRTGGLQLGYVDIKKISISSHIDIYPPGMGVDDWVPSALLYFEPRDPRSRTPAAVRLNRALSTMTAHPPTSQDDRVVRLSTSPLLPDVRIEAEVVNPAFLVQAEADSLLGDVRLVAGVSANRIRMVSRSLLGEVTSYLAQLNEVSASTNSLLGMVLAKVNIEVDDWTSYGLPAIFRDNFKYEPNMGLQRTRFYSGVVRQRRKWRTAYIQARLDIEILQSELSDLHAFLEEYEYAHWFMIKVNLGRTTSEQGEFYRARVNGELRIRSFKGDYCRVELPLEVDTNGW